QGRSDMDAEGRRTAGGRFGSKRARAGGHVQQLHAGLDLHRIEQRRNGESGGRREEANVALRQRVVPFALVCAQLCGILRRQERSHGSPTRFSTAAQLGLNGPRIGSPSAYRRSVRAVTLPFLKLDARVASGSWSACLLLSWGICAPRSSTRL